MFCIHCGNKLPGTAKFCPNCGNAVGELINEEIIEEADGSSINKNVILSETDLDADKFGCEEESETTLVDDYDFENDDDEDICMPAWEETYSVAGGALTDNHGVGNKKKVLAVAILIAVIIAVISVLLPVLRASLPVKARETGDYVLSVGDSVEFTSVKSKIEFLDFVVKPNYSDLSADVEFIFSMQLPDRKSCERYASWLDDFQVNGIPVEPRLGINFAGMFLESEPEELTTETMIFSVLYHSSYKTHKEDTHTLTCVAGEDINISFEVKESFWEMVGIDPNNYMVGAQAWLDQQYGITLYNLTKNQNPDFEVGDWYRLTATVLYSGKYMGDLTDKYQICFSMAESDWPSYYCYFSEDEWNRIPTLSSGDVLTIYGRYDYVALIGDNFNDCTIESPAGTFVWKEDGTAELVPFGMLRNYQKETAKASERPETGYSQYDLMLYQGGYLDASHSVDLAVRSDGDSFNCDLYWFYGKVLEQGVVFPGVPTELSGGTVITIDLVEPGVIQVTLEWDQETCKKEMRVDGSRHDGVDYSQYNLAIYQGIYEAKAFVVELVERSGGTDFSCALRWIDGDIIEQGIIVPGDPAKLSNGTIIILHLDRSGAIHVELERGQEKYSETLFKVEDYVSTDNMGSRYDDGSVYSDTYGYYTNDTGGFAFYCGVDDVDEAYKEIFIFDYGIQGNPEFRVCACYLDQPTIRFENGEEFFDLTIFAPGALEIKCGTDSFCGTSREQLEGLYYLRISYTDP